MAATSTNGRAQQLDAAMAAAESLAPEVGALLSTVDPAGFGSALVRTGLGVLSNPLGAFGAWSRFAGGLTLAGAAATARVLGADAQGPAQPAPKDRRFADPAWSSNPGYFLLMQSYLLGGRLVDELIDVAGLDDTTRKKAEFAAHQLVDAAAPTNTPLNPVVLKRALETGGLSMVRGFRSFLTDLSDNNGLPKQVDRSGFRVGKNLGATKGKVVLRNELMELVQYEPQSETVYQVPLLMSPPWINKYYIMDLAPGRSFIEWAVQHGHTVFAISYRNPDATMRDVRLDDYLLHGPHSALEAIESITGTKATNIVGLCLGGSLTTMLCAWLARNEPERVNAVTLLNTINDFREPGVLGTLTDEKTVAAIERQIMQKGFLDSKQLATTFTMLRSNDLIWSYVVNNWMLGENPPAFDILAWNDDSTRLPAAMQSFYLRSCYMRNDFAEGRMELAGQDLDPKAITQDLYVLSAIEDHIAPWKTAYATTQVLPNAKTRFVLSSSGHIAGIVNPPNPKSSYWTNTELPPEPDRWLAGAETHGGSWWEDWTEWIGERAGGRVSPPPLGNDEYSPAEDAPGTYVFGT
jgi:polyhydroxyalkanoate synthase